MTIIMCPEDHDDIYKTYNTRKKAKVDYRAMDCGKRHHEVEQPKSGIAIVKIRF